MYDMSIAPYNQNVIVYPFIQSEQQCFQTQGREGCIDKVDEQTVITKTLDDGIRSNACKDSLA